MEEVYYSPYQHLYNKFSSNGAEGDGGKGCRRAGRGILTAHSTQAVATTWEDVEEVVRELPARLPKVDVSVLQERLALDIDEERTSTSGRLEREVPRLRAR